MPSVPQDCPETGPPFWSIGLAMVLMLAVPVILYSIAPAGPIREGDTIFADEATNVKLARPLLYESANFDDTCLLDPHDPLMVVQRPSDRSDGMVLAKVQGKTMLEWPFCPPQAEVILALHQIMQKPDVLTDMKSNLAEWWKRQGM
jgi:hypothetical protein